MTALATAPTASAAESPEAQAFEAAAGPRFNPDLTARYAPCHRKGYDCRVTNARNLLEFFGHPYSYSTVHGLSASFFFVYRKTDTELSRLLFPDGNFAHRFWPISGQQLEVMENLSFLLGATRVGDGDQSAEASLSAIRAHLNQGLPVMVALCREKLLKIRGLPTEQRWFPEDLGFGGHWVLVTEIDDRQGLVRLFETDEPRPMSLTFEQFHEVRTWGDDQPDFYMKSRNRWMVFHPPRRLPSFRFMVETAICRVVQNMRHPLLERECGMAAFDDFCREVLSWPHRDDLTAGKLELTVSMMFLASELMVGGGMGRKSYGLFLNNAHRELDEPLLRRAARGYGEAGKLWRRLMLMLFAEVLEKPGPWDLQQSQFVDLVGRLHSAEWRGFEALERFAAERLGLEGDAPEPVAPGPVTPEPAAAKLMGAEP